MKDSKKIALYVRVSTADQKTLNQKLVLEEYCQSRNIDYDIFEEVESTRKTRPVKAELVKRLRNKEFTGVMVYKLDRWARSSSELILEITELTERGIDFISVTEQLDLTSSSGKLMFTILSAFASFERDLIRERTLEGLSRAKSEGKKLGRPKGSKDSGKRKKAGYLLRAIDNRK